MFEQSAPTEIVSTLRGHLSALEGLVSENTRRRDDEFMRRGVEPEKSAEDREQSLLRQIDRARTSDERDRLYLQLALNSLERNDLDGREFVSKVENSELRNQAQIYVDSALAIEAVKKKLTDQALELVHKGELSHLVKSWVLSEVAKQLIKMDRQRALDLIRDAAEEARRIDVPDRSRPQALLAVANALQIIDTNLVWEATFDAIKAANSAEEFTGEDGELLLKFQGKGGPSAVSNYDVPEFNVDRLFRLLASIDYERAVSLARGFQGEGPRAMATIAIARAILEQKKQQ